VQIVKALGKLLGAVSTASFTVTRTHASIGRTSNAITAEIPAQANPETVATASPPYAFVPQPSASGTFGLLVETRPSIGTTSANITEKIPAQRMLKPMPIVAPSPRPGTFRLLLRVHALKPTFLNATRAIHMGRYIATNLVALDRGWENRLTPNPLRADY